MPFFKILKWKEGVYETLLEMHRCGILGAFIPEFGRLLCMVLHDAYHIYTVDQHSLKLIQEIERLKAGDYKEIACPCSPNWPAKPTKSSCSISG